MSDPLSNKVVSWGVEVEYDGASQPDYYSVESMILDESGIHIHVVDGTSVEYAPGSVRKILIMRSKD